MSLKPKSLHTLSILLSVGLLIASLAPSPALAQEKCEGVFYSLTFKAIDSFKAEKLSEKTSTKYMKAAEAEQKSTTGNRVERKFTSPFSKITGNLDKMTEGLRATFPDFKLDARDKKTAGFSNITYTKYLTKLQLNFQGKKLVTKIRLRKYGLIGEETTVNVLNFKPIKAMFDEKQNPISWLEFKIEHPEYENAVLKPRIKFHDRYAELFAKPAEFKRKLSVIRRETKKLNTETLADGKVVNKDQQVDDMLEAVAQTLNEHINLRPISETLYERTSYAVNLTDKKTNETVNVQFTLDRDIHQFSMVLGKEVTSYDPALDLSVLEIKVPVRYAQFSKEDLQNVPGLGEVVGLIERMKTAQQPGYDMDKGKFSRAVRVLEAEDDL